jgi:hypothetical protein
MTNMIFTGYMAVILHTAAKFSLCKRALLFQYDPQTHIHNADIGRKTILSADGVHNGLDRAIFFPKIGRRTTLTLLKQIT